MNVLINVLLGAGIPLTYLAIGAACARVLYTKWMTEDKSHNHEDIILGCVGMVMAWPIAGLVWMIVSMVSGGYGKAQEQQKREKVSARNRINDIESQLIELRKLKKDETVSFMRDNYALTIRGLVEEKNTLENVVKRRSL